MLFDYDSTSPESILKYAKQLEGHTFTDILNNYLKYCSRLSDKTADLFKNTPAKGQLGVFLEEYYFGYKPNSEQAADFLEAGVELKQTCVDLKKDGEYTAGERLSITNISFEKPIEEDFYQSDVWHKIHLILLIHYLRDKKINRMDYKILFANLFTPPEKDLKIIIEDYKRINQKIQSGLAHEISEGDTLYLGACTKGSTAKKSTRPQFYGNHTPARKRNFCFKRSYMDYILHSYVLKDAVPCELLIHNTRELDQKSFEEIILERINHHIGSSDQELCAYYNRTYNNNKAQWVDLAYRMLGIKSNQAEEFEKSNIVVKTIRLEKDNIMRESMSFPAFKFLDLIDEEWEDSNLFNYFSETKFLFVIFKRNESSYILQKAKFWNMPYDDLENEVHQGWEDVKSTIISGVDFIINPNGSVSNNLLNKRDNRIIHVRPHSTKSAYKLHNGFTKGNIERDANPLPDGQWMTTQSFWINNSYILEIIK